MVDIWCVGFLVLAAILFLWLIGSSLWKLFGIQLFTLLAVCFGLPLLVGSIAYAVFPKLWLP